MLPLDKLEDVMADLLPGTLEVLVLKALSLEPMHGWGIGQRIDQLSRDVFRVRQGSLYPALQRLLKEGLVKRIVRFVSRPRFVVRLDIVAKLTVQDEVARLWTPRM